MLRVEDEHHFIDEGPHNEWTIALVDDEGGLRVIFTICPFPVLPIAQFNERYPPILFLFCHF